MTLLVGLTEKQVCSNDLFPKNFGVSSAEALTSAHRRALDGTMLLLLAPAGGNCGNATRSFTGEYRAA